MSILEHTEVLEILPLGVGLYDKTGTLTYSNKNSNKISPKLFPKKLEDLNITTSNLQKLKKGKTIFVEDCFYYNLNIKPLKNMDEGCIILARDISDTNGYIYMSTHDLMTGLYNRNFFETEFERLKNGRDFPISIIFIDIDKLKNINDTYGHSYGDKVITKVSDILKNSIRKSDVVARIGGDEFVILVTKTNDGAVLKIINKIQKKFNSHNKKTKLPISVSMGHSTANDKAEMKPALTEADRKMYKQKKENHGPGRLHKSI